MGYYNEQAVLYELLSKVVHNTQLICIHDTSMDKVTPYPRMQESDFVITEEILRRNAAVVTAHNLNEYRPNQLKLERLMRQSDRLPIDILIEDIGGIRGVSIQSN